jgi:hypothetical protein
MYRLFRLFLDASIGQVIKFSYFMSFVLYFRLTCLQMESKSNMIGEAESNMEKTETSLSIVCPVDKVEINPAKLVKKLSFSRND